MKVVKRSWKGERTYDLILGNFDCHGAKFGTHEGQWNQWIKGQKGSR